MTNVFQPLGLVAIRNKFNSGAGAFNSYTIDPANATLIGINDLVKRSAGRTIAKAGPQDTPLGTFQGWRIRTRAIYGGSMGGAGSSVGVIPYAKSWNGAITVPSNMEIEAIVDDDPGCTFRAQLFSPETALTEADIGKLVDLVECPAGPDVNYMGRGKQAVGFPTTYYNISSYTVTDGGTGFTQDQVDLLVNGQIIDMRPEDIVVTAGVIISITPLNAVQGLHDNTPTVTVQGKPGYSGSGATITPVMSGAQTALQFRIERFLEQPMRVSDTYNRTTGYDLTNVGVNPWVEVAYARHARGGSALYA
jgi:hypothetical protein